MDIDRLWKIMAPNNIIQAINPIKRKFVYNTFTFYSRGYYLFISYYGHTRPYYKRIIALPGPIICYL